MPTAAVVMIVILLLAVIGLLLWLLNAHSQSRRDTAGSTAAISMLQQQLELFRGSQESTRQTLESSLSSGQQNISQTLQQQQQTLSQLHRQIGELQTQSNQVVSLNTDIRRLNDILSSPKLRGQLGEWSLENLLASVLPKDTYTLQHHFKDGKIVDALIQLPQFSVPIDAKFPLPGFEAILKCSSENDLPRLQRQFQKDVTTHIDKIAAQYIRPAEGTLDFALMYIPAENVYYETIIKNDGGGESIADYALTKKVVPVSPECALCLSDDGGDGPARHANRKAGGADTRKPETARKQFQFVCRGFQNARHTHSQYRRQVRRGRQKTNEVRFGTSSNYS